MAIQFRTQHKKDSARDMKNIHVDLRLLSASLPTLHNDIRVASTRCCAAKAAMKYLDQMGSTKAAEINPQLQSIVDAMRAAKPGCTQHDIYVGLENVLTDYAKKVETFAETMVTTVRQYSVGLFDLFVKKLRINKKIDTSKFIGVDASMRLNVIKYDDYCKIGNPIVEKSANVVKDVYDWSSSLGRVKKALASGDNQEITRTLGELTKKIHEGMMISYLKDNELVKFQYGVGFQNGEEGLINLSTTDKFKHLEQPYLLSEAGWGDVERIKNAQILQNVEEINKNINNLYKISIDLMDEVRRISSEFCVKEPYVCAALVKYGSLISQMVNIYTKSFDMCWTTCLRVTQACLVEE